MSRHYLLDGYNIIMGAPRLADLPLQEGREQLVHWINTSFPQGSRRNDVTVFFDGNPNHHGGMSSAGARVVFSDGQSADQAIKDVIDDAKDKKNFVVVSNDKGITLYARAQGVAILNIKEFAPELFGSIAKQHRYGPKQQSSKHITHTQAKQINDEFTKLWLT